VRLVNLPALTGAQRSKRYRAKHPDRVRAQNLAWRARNREFYLAQQRLAERRRQAARLKAREEKQKMEAA
jgi:hypothetical protein